MNTSMFQDGQQDYLTMVSSPNHATLSSPVHNYENAPALPTETGPETAPQETTTLLEDKANRQSRENQTHFKFPPASTTSDQETDPNVVIEDDDNYVKPINVHEKRAEFAQQQRALKESKPLHSPTTNYYNAPLSNLQLDHCETDSLLSKNSPDKKVPKSVNDKKYPPVITIKDNYVSMPDKKNEFRGNIPDSFSNPSYLFMSDTNKI